MSLREIGECFVIAALMAGPFIVEIIKAVAK